MPETIQDGLRESARFIRAEWADAGQSNPIVAQKLDAAADYIDQLEEQANADEQCIDRLMQEVDDLRNDIELLCEDLYKDV